MHILLTRPLDDCKHMILRFKDLGHQVSHLPLIEISPENYKAFNFDSFKGVIFTSANSIKYLDKKNLDKKIKCFCVGNLTENEAKQKGFQNIYSAEGNVNNLKELIIQNFDKNEGKLLYISGEITSSRLDEDLIKEGFLVERLVNYSVKHIQNLDKDFIENLKKTIPDVVYVYSENSAKSFTNIIKKYNLVDYWMNTNLMCLGEKTSSVLNEFKWKKIFLFNPGEEEFLLYKI